jgi:membrane fusion protein, heavy metal efflux system
MRAPPSFAVLLTVAFLTFGCSKSRGADQKPTPPAKIERPAKEIDIGTITLTAEAERRLAVKTAPIQRRKVARARTVGGQSVVPPGASAIVSAPLSGALQPAGGVLPHPGSKVTRGQVLFVLSLTAGDRLRFAESKASLASARVDAEGAVARANLEIAATQIALERAEKLALDQVGSAQRVDDARAQKSLAQAQLVVAVARRKVVTGSAGEAGAAASIPIESPIDGLLLRVNVLPGQVVPAGAPLFEVIRPDPMWIQVPVYAGDLGSFDITADALIAGLTGSKSEGARPAKPVPAPPSANSNAATVDLFYELANPTGDLRPGQSVNVTLPLQGEEESLVVPWAAVVHDIYGGTWVYELTGPLVYVRRRVQVRHVVSGFGVLADGPKVGMQVVTDGAAELFGAEFGTGK